MAIKLPESFLKASSTVSEKVAATAKVQASVHSKVTARIDMSADVAGAGLCPECRKPMKEGMANGMPVQYCLSHRIALPLADASMEGPPVE